MLNQSEMWEVPSAESAAGLLAELRLELPAGHDLFDLDCTVVAKRVDSDDILVGTQDGRFAVVHLTWKASTEIADQPTCDWSDANICLELIGAIQ
jgi:hypothetical protein